VGGRLSTVFDEDPKRWRMLAEALGTLGMSLEIATAFAPPQAFLLLAGVLSEL
jgi:Vitamin B6 photo-protection and homoeostasis